MIAPLPRIVLVSCLFVVGVWPATVLAQPDEPPAAGLTDAERAVEMGRAALAEFEAGRFDAAQRQFQQADQLAHSPVFVLFMARCKSRLDQLLAARVLYRSLLAETLPGDAPAQWGKAQQDGRTELTELEAAIPTLSIEAPPDAQVTLDGKPLSATERARVELDPGEHAVSATMGEHPASDRLVTLTRGKAERVVFEPPPTPSLGPAPAPQPDPVMPAPDAEGSIVPGAALLGLAGAAVVAGAITGAIALKKANDVVSRCDPDGACRGSELTADRDAATRIAHGATASFAIAGAAAVMGIILVIVRPGGGDAQTGFDPTTLSYRF